MVRDGGWTTDEDADEGWSASASLKLRPEDEAALRVGEDSEYL